MDENKFDNNDFGQDVLDDNNVVIGSESLADDENFADELTFDNAFVEIPVISTDVTESSHTTKRNGIKLFFALICFLLAVSIAAAAGYIVGSNKDKIIGNGITLAPKPSTNEVLTTEEVYNKVNPSVVGITIYNDKGVSGYASGVVYSEDGYIITNDHIYENVKNAKFKIHDYQSNSFDAHYVAGDARSDLAVLKIDSDGFFPATFGNSDEINFGESVVAIGRPNSPSDDSSITKGIISYPKRRVTNSTNYSSKLIQTDSAINPGSSGGALVNMYGQIVGITSSKLVGDSYEGVGYAIPTVTVKRIIDSLIENGTVVNRGKLGFTYQQLDSFSETNGFSYGLLIASVSEDSDMLNKVVAGDIITAVNGEKIVTDDVLIDTLEATLPGETLTMDIFTKSGITKQIKVKVLHDYGTSSYVTEEVEIPLLPQN